MTNFNDNLLQSFASNKVLIIGDLVADQYLTGTIARVSREAPVFILRHDVTITLPGAAANAAANVASLGGSPSVVGVIGNDANGELLNSSLEDCKVDISGVVTDDSISTTTKLRVLAGQPHAVHQQVIRIDYENRSELSDVVRRKLIDNITAAGDDADAIILSDYNYGVADASIFDAARILAEKRGIPLLVDSRFRLRDFVGATAATPNQEEVEQILGKDFSALEVEALCRDLGYKALLVTNGNKGMDLFQSNVGMHHFDAVGSLDPVDVTGAGDTVMAAFALGLASGIGFREAARIANHAGGIVVMKKGTATVKSSELILSLNEHSKIPDSMQHV